MQNKSQTFGGISYYIIFFLSDSMNLHGRFQHDLNLNSSANLRATQTILNRRPTLDNPPQNIRERRQSTRDLLPQSIQDRRFSRNISPEHRPSSERNRHPSYEAVANRRYSRDEGPGLW